MGMRITDTDGSHHIQGYPWMLGGRHEAFINAKAEKDEAKRRGYDAKIRRRPDGTYRVLRRAKSKRFEVRLEVGLKAWTRPI